MTDVVYPKDWRSVATTKAKSCTSSFIRGRTLRRCAIAMAVCHPQRVALARETASRKPVAPSARNASSGCTPESQPSH